MAAEEVHWLSWAHLSLCQDYRIWFCFIILSLMSIWTSRVIGFSWNVFSEVPCTWNIGWNRKMYHRLGFLINVNVGNVELMLANIVMLLHGWLDFIFFTPLLLEEVAFVRYISCVSFSFVTLIIWKWVWWSFAARRFQAGYQVGAGSEWWCGFGPVPLELILLGLWGLEKLNCRFSMFFQFSSY